MMLRAATTVAAPAPLRRTAAHAAPAARTTQRRRLVLTRYQGDERDRLSSGSGQQLRTPNAAAGGSNAERPYWQQSSPYYGGYGNEDPSESLRQGWDNLRAKWDAWPADDRNRTLAWGAGGLLVLYLANGLINAIDRLPLLPAALQLIGFGYSAWFTWRFLLFAEGRRDLASLSLDELLGRGDVRDDVSVGDAARELQQRSERVLGKDPVARAYEAAKDNSSSGSRLSDGSGGGYSRGRMESDIKGALHDLDELAE